MSSKPVEKAQNLSINLLCNDLEIEEIDSTKQFEKKSELDKQMKEELCSAMMHPSQMSFISQMGHKNQSLNNSAMTQGGGNKKMSPFDSILDLYRANPALYQTIPLKERNKKSTLMSFFNQDQINNNEQSKYEQNTVHEMVENRQKFPLVGFFFLLVAILSGASSVPFQVHLPLKTPFLKLSWRQLNMLPFLIVMAGVQTYFDNNFKLREIMNWQTLKFILIVAFVGDCMSLSNVFGGQYSIMSHALIFSNLGGVLIVIHSLIMRRFVHKLEILGTTIAVVGCFLTVLDKNAKKVDSSQQNILLGDLIAFCSSCFSAFYYQANQQIVSKMPPLLGITIVMFFSQLMLQAFGCLFIPNFDISANPETGSFGFINVDYWPYVVFALGFITGTCSYGATAMVLKYCSPLFLCTALLFTPIVGQAYGVMLGIDKLPGFLTMAGTLVTMAGLYFVSAGGRARAQMTKKL